MVEVKRQLPHLTGTLLLASLVSVGFLAVSVIRNDNYAYGFMVWNLFLAWLPLLFVRWLLRMLKHKRWSSWQGIVLSVLWLGFLPNAFYIVTDYIHLFDIASTDILYDAVMLTSFVLTGLVLGYTSLYLFHLELRKRLPRRTANRMVGAVLFLSSVAIYLGRDLRWNSWDLFLNPAGILFDVSDRLLSPGQHPGMFLTVGSFFVLLSMFYIVAWQLVTAARATAPKDL